jgi:hypothetical protein
MACMQCYSCCNMSWQHDLAASGFSTGSVAPAACLSLTLMTVSNASSTASRLGSCHLYLCTSC